MRRLTLFLSFILVSLLLACGSSDPAGTTDSSDQDQVSQDVDGNGDVAPQDLLQDADPDAPPSTDTDVAVVPDLAITDGTVGDIPTDVAPDLVPDTATDTITDPCGGDCPPSSVEFTTPMDGETVHGVVTLEALAQDDKGIAKIAFYVDSVLLGEVSQTPFQLLWDSSKSSDGAHTLKARAVDTNGAFIEASLVVQVDNCGAAVFFDPAQVALDVNLGTTTDTISSEGYLFTYTRDKLFTGGVGMTDPIGRAVRVPWPEGIEAQAITMGPVGDAKLVISRQDGGSFAIKAIKIKLLGNTASTGAAIEIMPKLNGEDGLPDPVALDVSGYYGIEFSYDTSANILGTTALLTGFESYSISLFVDFAITGLTLECQ